MTINLDPVEVAKLISYEPDTGIFRRRTARGRMKIGDPCGIRTPGREYAQIRVLNKLCRASRLAFVLMEGRWPVHLVDHIDGDKWNNKWINLREATPAENMFNRGLDRRNVSGCRGVQWYPDRQKWVVTLCKGRQRFWFGAFTDKDDACRVARNAAEILYGDFFRSSAFMTSETVGAATQKSCDEAVGVRA